MHIKRLIVEGFRSYKDRTVVEFDPRHNVVVGKNGAGKSNVFFAIQFVLSDKFATLRQEERQRLLHEGSGRAVLTASVEIIFDNSDMRFPLDDAEITLKRAIGVKKDEYFLNNKHTTKSDVESLLESAGLSKTNPYNIVQQGKVNHIIKMKDSQRLDLLKEIAGTRVYDERRKDSMKIMAETTNRRNQIQDIVSYIETRLAELEEEQKELKKFQTQDKQRRCLEYTIYNKELRNAEQKLEEIEGLREAALNRASTIHSEAVRLREERKNMESEIAELEIDVKNLELEKKRIMQEKRAVVRRQAEFNCDFKDASSKSKSDKKRVHDWEQQLQALNKEIKTKQQKLAMVTKDYDAKLKEEQEIQKNLTQKETRLQDLFSKQGRREQFSSKDERDAYLRKEIQTLKEVLEDERKQGLLRKKEIDSTRKSIEAQNDVVIQTRKEIQSTQGRITSITKQYRETSQKRDVATEKRKDLWREQHDIETKQKQTQHNLKKAQHDLESTMSKRHYKGIAAVKHIVQQHEISGYYGTLADCFKVTNDAFTKCVEVTAGNRLFFHVVDTDETASKILRHLNRERIGRVTFMPLNRLASKKQKQVSQTDIFPILSALEFNDMHRKAVFQVFANTMVARSLTIGANFAREHDFDIVTLDGDQVSKRGTLSGGFVEFRRSRLAAISEMQKAAKELIIYESLIKEKKDEVSLEDQNVNASVGYLSKLEAEKKHFKRVLADKNEEMRFATREQRQFEKSMSKMETALSKTSGIINVLQQKITSLEEEMQMDLLSELNSEERNELHELNEKVASLKHELAEAATARSRIEIEKNLLYNALNVNLLQTKVEVESRLNEVTAEEQAEQLDRLSHELQAIKVNIAELDVSAAGVDGELDAKNERVRDLQSLLETRKEEENDFVRQLRNSSKTTEKLSSKRSALTEKKNDCLTKSRALGSLPRDAFERYTKHSIKTLMSMLSKCNVELRQYSHVNKKAIDQYQNFTQQRDNLLARKEEQDRGKVAIENLIEHLDQKKDEAINRTFLGIAKHFSNVFQELVPDGKGTIVMQTKKAGKRGIRGERTEIADDMKDEELSERDDSSIAKRYTGVGIKVSFTGSGETFSMNQLSGGQQTVVALALIFAIQRCDPSPFYLFDEIDSALDSQYRTAVANMIRRYSERQQHESESTPQFITTTFRPEFLNVADKFFGVLYENKISKIRSISKDRARSIIQSVDVPMEE